MEKSNSRIFIFNGADLAGKGEDFLREVCRKGYALLALDAAALEAAVKDDLPVEFLDKWLPYEEMVRLREQAIDAKTQWFLPEAEAFTWDGLCWPKADSLAMAQFWPDALTALDLARVLQSEGVEDLRFVQPPYPLPAIYYSPSDIWRKILGISLPEKTHSFPSSLASRFPHALQPIRQAAQQTKRKIRSLFRTPAMDDFFFSINAVPLSLLQGRIVFAINGNEIYRQINAIKTVSEYYPNRVAIVSFGFSKSRMAEITEELQVPVFHFTPPRQGQPDAIRHFCAAIDALRNRVEPSPWSNVLKGASHHFDFYCRHRWPSLAAWLDLWGNLWSQARPDLVLVSSLLDLESQLPAVAANRLAIPTANVHHAAFGYPPPSSFYAPRTTICSLPIHRSVAACFGVSPDRIRECRDFLTEEEYPASPPRKRPKRSGTIRVLVLTGPTTRLGCFSPPSISMGYATDLYRSLNRPPEDLAERFDFHLKIHPGFPEYALYQHADKNLMEWILPRESSLKAVLPETDLVISIDYYGSALIHILRAGKPIIFYGPDDPHPLMQDITQSGTSVASPELFWETMRRFAEDHEFAKLLEERSRNYSRINLDGSAFPNAFEVLEKIRAGE